MEPARRHKLLFVLGTAGVLAAGYAAGYANAYGRFYSPEALLDRELVHMDFNSRLLHYTNLGRQADCRRELVQRLRGEVAFVRQQSDDRLPPGEQATVRVSIEHARTVIEGHPMVSPPPPAERD